MDNQTFAEEIWQAISDQADEDGGCIRVDEAKKAIARVLGKKLSAAQTPWPQAYFAIDGTVTPIQAPSVAHPVYVKTGEVSWIDRPGDEWR